MAMQCLLYSGADMNKGICVVGPTASGKSGLALMLAQKYDGEIVSSDSMQLYKDMNIGTAKPTQTELSLVKHHMIDILDMDEEFSVSEYVKRASRCVDDILQRARLPILCGGTGLYVDSFVNETIFCEYDITEEAKLAVQKIYDSGFEQALWDELSRIDPEAAANVHPSNKKRIIRALHVFYSTGVTVSEWNRRSVPKDKKYDFLMLGICFENREILYERINRRVDMMFEQGLLQEVEALYKRGLLSSKTASQAIGYKEFVPYFENGASLSDVSEIIKQETRRYAKRQMTWFKRNENIKWIKADNLTANDVFISASEYVDQFLG